MNYMPQYAAQQAPIYGQQFRQTYSPSGPNWTNRIRPVSSIEEVRASAIDFDGSVFYFPDLANKKIYTKQINLDGTASLNMYELKEIPVAATAEVNTFNFITREEFNNAIMELRGSLAQPVYEDPEPPTASIPKAPVPNFNF